jgi:hypothetical protein
MKHPRRGAFENEDFERTDTLPMLPDLEEDTGGLAAPQIAALPVDVAGLAESLRERELQLEQAARRATELEARLAAATARCEQLQRECAALRAAAPPPDAAGQPVPTEDPQLQALRRQNASLHDALCSMHAQMGVREGQLAEAEEALRKALHARGAQADAPLDWQARSAELYAALESERGAAAAQAAAQAERLAVIEAELVALRARLPAPDASAAPAPFAEPTPFALPRPIGSVLRVLVREEGGTEVVYPLGRHTTIGRTPDNDIQVNTTYVSRNHAVLLAGTDHCIVEDLNSTNGVLVNGHRVGRQLLNDGDIVTIGKTHFRFQQRS